MFSKLTSADEGRYQCTAHNVVGTRETSPVLLSVHGKKSNRMIDQIIIKLQLCPSDLLLRRLNLFTLRLTSVSLMKQIIIFICI